VLLNYGALTYWFFFDPDVRRDARRLGPALDVLPILFVGGTLTWALIAHGRHDSLFGAWMSLFGLANLASRQVLPRMTAWVGLFYLLAGTCCLLSPSVRFLNPWPMGLVFFAGEWLGGIVFHFDANRLSDFWKREEE
jgi:hypothetical protein